MFSGGWRSAHQDGWQDGVLHWERKVGQEKQNEKNGEKEFPFSSAFQSRVSFIE